MYGAVPPPAPTANEAVAPGATVMLAGWLVIVTAPPVVDSSTSVPTLMAAYARLTAIDSALPTPYSSSAACSTLLRASA
ncbi:hypothetical protein D3C85_853300 [compost metagenome]